MCACARVCVCDGDGGSVSMTSANERKKQRERETGTLDRSIDADGRRVCACSRQIRRSRCRRVSPDAAVYSHTDH